jgi:hypothetical protein
MTKAKVSRVDLVPLLRRCAKAVKVGGDDGIAALIYYAADLLQRGSDLSPAEVRRRIRAAEAENK